MTFRGLPVIGCRTWSLNHVLMPLGESVCHVSVVALRLRYPNSFNTEAGSILYSVNISNSSLLCRVRMIGMSFGSELLGSARS